VFEKKVITSYNLEPTEYMIIVLNSSLFVQLIHVRDSVPSATSTV
jgi:hypothetical protein